MSVACVDSAVVCTIGGPFLMILPSFITNETRSVAVMSAVGSPGIAMISASFPFSSVPTFCAIPKSSASFAVADFNASIGVIPRSHARTDNYTLVNRIAQRHIDKFAAADKPAPQIADRGEAGFNGGACVRRRLDRLLGHVEIKLVQPAHIVISGVIQREMRVCIHESRRKRRVGEVDHLRTAWDRQIAAYVDNLIALDDNDSVLHERFRFLVENSLRFEHDNVVGGLDWNRAGGKRKDGENKPRAKSTTSQDIHSRDIEASREQSKTA